MLRFWTVKRDRYPGFGHTRIVGLGRLLRYSYRFFRQAGSGAADNVEEELDKEEIYPINKEGYNTAEWVLLGYDDVIVHIFQRETREFYGLEHVWQDAPEVDITGLLV